MPFLVYYDEEDTENMSNNQDSKKEKAITCLLAISCSSHVALVPVKLSKATQAKQNKENQLSLKKKKKATALELELSEHAVEKQGNI